MTFFWVVRSARLMASEKKKIHRTISLFPEEEARLLAAVRRDHGANFSHWLVGLGLKRADELELPNDVAAPRKKKRGRPAGDDTT